MSFGVERLHHAVIRPFVGHVEGAEYGAAVRVASFVEDLRVQLVVEVVHGVVERDQDYLGGVLGRYACWDVCAGAATIGKDAVATVAFLGHCQGTRSGVHWIRSRGRK